MAQETKKGTAGPVTLMVIAVMGAALLAYTSLFPVSDIPIFILLSYLPIVTVIAVLLYWKLSRRVKG
jgi:hypothetical protein